MVLLKKKNLNHECLLKFPFESVSQNPGSSLLINIDVHPFLRMELRTGFPKFGILNQRQGNSPGVSIIINRSEIFRKSPTDSKFMFISNDLEGDGIIFTAQL